MTAVATYGPSPVLDENGSAIPNVPVNVLPLSEVGHQLYTDATGINVFTGSVVKADPSGSLTFYGTPGVWDLTWPGVYSTLKMRVTIPVTGGGGGAVASVTAGSAHLTASPNIGAVVVDLSAADQATLATVVGKAPTSRLISTTAPLTGGGDLSADRTLGVTIGTAAGTVADGGVVAAQTAAIATKAPLASPAFTGAPTAPTPTTSTGLAIKSYVDGLVQAGFSQGHTAVALATANQAALTGLPTVDGVTLGDSQTLLLTGQTTGSQNGLWSVHAGAWTRPTFFATGSDVTGSYVFVEGGTVWGGALYALNGLSPQTVDTTALVFVQFDRISDVLPGTALTKTGNTFNVTLGTATGTAFDGGSGATNTTNIGTNTAAIATKQSRWNMRVVATVGGGSTYALAAYDELEVDCTLGNATANLPAGVAGDEIEVKKSDVSGNTITVMATVEGVVNPTVAAQYQTLTLRYDGAKWVRAHRPNLATLVDYPAATDGRYVQSLTTATGAIGAPNPLTLFAIQPRDPARAKFRLMSQGSNFTNGLGTAYDDVFTLGYNINPAGGGGQEITAEPSMVFQIETNYNEPGGHAWVECFWQYTPPNAAFAAIRPIAAVYDKNASTAAVANVAGMALAAESFTFSNAAQTKGMFTIGQGQVIIKAPNAATTSLEISAFTGQASYLQLDHNAASLMILSTQSVNYGQMTVAGNVVCYFLKGPPAGLQIVGQVGFNNTSPIAKPVALPADATAVAAVTATAIAVTPAAAVYTQADQTALANEVIALRNDVVALQAELATNTALLNYIKNSVIKPYGLAA